MPDPTPADRPTDQLREHLTAAVVETMLPRYGGPQHNTPGGLSLTATAEEIRLHRARPVVEAVLSVLPAPALAVARQLLGTTTGEGAHAACMTPHATRISEPAPADRAAVLREAAEEFRATFGDVILRGKDGTWANIADWTATGAQIPACGSFYPHHTDTRCVLHKGHRGSHRAPWGNRDMAWPYDRRETQPDPATTAGATDRSRLAGEAAAGVQQTTTSEPGFSYRLEHRHREEAAWRPNTPGIGANWSWQSREKAAQRLAEARTRWPDFEHRLIEATTTVAARVLPDCLACGHYQCDGDGPCEALLDSWQRCTCTATPPAAPAVPEEPQ